MKNILNFNEYKKLNERYEETPEYRIRKFFEKLKKSIKNWFTDGSFSDCELFDIKINTTNNLDKTLIFDFLDSRFYYQIIVITSLVEVTEKTLEECYIKVKRYDSDTNELLHETDESVMTKDLSEDTFIQLIAKLDENTEEELNNGDLSTSTEDKVDFSDTDDV